MKHAKKQVPSGYSVNIVSSHRKTSKQSYYCGADAVSAFPKEMRKLAYKFINICKKLFGKAKKHRKVRDRDHYTGKCRGAAHSICNLRYSTRKDIPVFFHNGTNYDFNLIINELVKEFRS